MSILSRHWGLSCCLCVAMALDRDRSYAGVMVLLDHSETRYGVMVLIMLSQNIPVFMPRRFRTCNWMGRSATEYSPSDNLPQRGVITQKTEVCVLMTDSQQLLSHSGSMSVD